ncbi:MULTISPECIES: fibrillarin-like rRNA/tRNA 2'-O-methyltransferase [Methanobacterium]|uniref:Fibrillarin-like rRNA/tRNA 2'-O-methyltransferase n=1 Tax=Methanobacterium veterum TaxID=408577 RepID=A0A9E4ZYS9_9EURY|nr:MULTISPECIES: fibrillarin-like rRNA/tRNA 2'-O-methyltransferase [Methanobacterium]MCZ3366020.1 fibrillarin-like rRNA/tRNA 2'-O-methyltransferase [Methanobacterium veterum]MCZ3371485.1 fibrillarin-like rRNA/tRNA 2'-O-methyltransferase [Methanobacterium veterum]
MEITQILPGVYETDGHIATENLNCGIKVYGERLVEIKDKEYRIWDPRRSKLGAAILNGLETFPFKEDSKMLYLGASAGTTPSHISDVSKDGLIYCVEFSPRMMRDLAEVCRQRQNMVPILDDATKPKNYMNLVQKVDVVYSDVAQPKQSELFMDNMRLFLKEDGIGILMIKARSIDVIKSPKKIFKEEESKLKTAGFRVIEKINLEPYEKDHMAFVCEFSF